MLCWWYVSSSPSANHTPRVGVSRRGNMMDGRDARASGGKTPSSACSCGDGQLPGSVKKSGGALRSYFIDSNSKGEGERSEMAEIWCEVTAEADGGCEKTPRSARRRRMEIRRFRFVDEFQAESPEEARRKMQRLDLPDAASAESGDGWPRFGSASVCGRRRDMEDTVSVHPGFFRRDEEWNHFFGVFDGHGCSHVAESCRDWMHKMVAAEVEGVGSDLPLNWSEVMGRSFAQMDAEAVNPSRGPRNASCKCEMQSPKCEHVGSTAVVAVVSPSRIVVANCGDSRAVLCRKEGSIPLSVDHKPDRPDELERIEVAGGRVIYWEGARVLGVLAMSRAIGDSHLKPYVIPEAEVTITERTGAEECLILASDGLWDVVSNEMACDIVRVCLRNSGPEEDGGEGTNGGSDKACFDAAMLLTKLAVARNSWDNVSVLVIDLRRIR